MRAQGAKASPSYVSTRRHCCAREASSIYQMTRVVAVRKLRRGNRDTLVGRVHEAPRADVDADVVDVVPADAEEHEVAGRKLRERHRLRGALLLGQIGRASCRERV